MTKPEYVPREELHLCAYDVACGRIALCSVTIDGKRTNICRDHYHGHFSGRARSYAELKGLYTIQQMNEYANRKLAELAAKNPSAAWIERLAERRASGELFTPMITAMHDRAASLGLRSHPLTREREPGSDDE